MNSKHNIQNQYIARVIKFTDKFYFIFFFIIFISFVIPAASTKLKWGHTGFTLSVCPSVRPSVRLSVCWQNHVNKNSWDPFHICTSCQATSEAVSHVKFVSKFKHLTFWQILWICNFNFVFFWLGIQNMTQWYGKSWGGGGILRTQAF